MIIIYSKKTKKILARIARMDAQEFRERMRDPKFIAKLEKAGIKTT
jgi:hypothetical protein